MDNYTVRELKRLIKESEFQPKLGPNVNRDNKSNNEKSYKDSAKRTKDYDGGLKSEKSKFPPRNDFNKTMLDLMNRTEVDDETKKRIKAQVKGYSSELEEKNGTNKNATFDGNEQFLKDEEGKRDDLNKMRTDFAKSGLQARELNDKYFKTNNLTEGRKIKRLTFKKRFINEANMLQRIPDEFVTDGQRIQMIDRDGNEYMVECVYDNKSKIIERNVVSYRNKRKMNEEVDRMYALFDYDPSRNDTKQGNREKIAESRTFGELMDLARGKKNPNQI